MAMGGGEKGNARRAPWGGNLAVVFLGEAVVAGGFVGDDPVFAVEPAPQVTRWAS